MTALRRVIQWLGTILYRPTGPKDFDFATLGFEPFNIDAISRFLRLRELAKDNGSKEIPATADTERDGPQESIIHFIHGRIARSIASAGVEVTGYNKTIMEIDISRRVDAIERLSDQFRQTLDLISDGAQAAFARYQNAVRKRSQQLERFRKDNKLVREPDYPDTYTLRIGILLTVLLSEAALNSYFFKLGNPLGVLGGAYEAFLLALVDILFCFMMGQLARFAVCIRPMQRLLGILGWIAFICWGVLYNLYVSHYREQLSLNPEGAFSSATHHFLTNMFGLQKVDSWMLFIFGFAFSVAAMLDSLHWDDVYPKYGRMHRMLREAEDDFESQRIQLIERLTETRTEYVDKLDQMAASATNDLAILESRIDTKRTLLRNVRLFLGNIEHACNALIKTYRDVNRQYRTTDPPAYFQDRWDYPLPEELQSDTQDDERKLVAQRRDLARVSGAKRRARGEIEALYEEKMCQVRNNQRGAISSVNYQGSIA